MRIAQKAIFGYIIAYSYVISRFLRWYLQKHPLRNLRDTRNPRIWQVDEKQVSILGITFWLMSVIDLTTEFIIVLKVFRSRTNENLANALRESKRLVGRIPKVVETDAYRGYSKAVRRVFGDVTHWKAKKGEWYGINNLVENFNSILEAWMKPHKSFHSLWTAQLIADGLWVQYNFVRKSTSQYLLGQTRAETAGFDLKLEKPWTELVSLAERAALLGHIPRRMQPEPAKVQMEMDEYLPSPNAEQATPVPDAP